MMPRIKEENEYLLFTWDLRTLVFGLRAYGPDSYRGHPALVESALQPEFA
jgi:hypothetical protein